MANVQELEVLYSDEDLIVVNKPPGMAVHEGVHISEPTVADFLLQKFPEIIDVGDCTEKETRQKGIPYRPGIVHRLDKNTSGVMVAARNQKSFEALKKLFQDRAVEKQYWAICCGALREERGTISLPIGRMVSNPLKRGALQGKAKIRGARDAETHYRVIRGGEKYTLVEVTPKTGRMHQIRVHLVAIGHPIACDVLYGGKKVCCPADMGLFSRGEAHSVGRQLLHAHSLSFSFPEGRKLRFEADPPEDFRIALEQIV